MRSCYDDFFFCFFVCFFSLFVYVYLWKTVPDFFSRRLDKVPETEILRGAKILGLGTSRERRKEVRWVQYYGPFSLIITHWWINDRWWCDVSGTGLWSWTDSERIYRSCLRKAARDFHGSWFFSLALDLWVMLKEMWKDSSIFPPFGNLTISQLTPII